jgi:hypothetical protein
METWSLDGYTNASVKRNTGFYNPLVQVNNSGSLTLENITLDGNRGVITAAKSLIYVNGGSLTLEDGAVLLNNSTASYAGAVRTSSSSSVVMNGDGPILNNSTAQFFSRGAHQSPIAHFVMTAARSPAILPPKAAPYM